MDISEGTMDKVEKAKRFLTVSKWQIIFVVIGNIMIGLGVAVLRVSQMGNDAYSAMNMSISGAVGISLGFYQMILNCGIFLIQWRYGKHYIGIGTIVNMFLLGYVVQYSIPIIEFLIGVEGTHAFGIQILIMLIAIIVISAGIACYQKADCGVAPFDYLSLGMTERFKPPYFINRMVTDGSALVVALVPWIFLNGEFSNCHIGIGTVCAVCMLGPCVALVDRMAFRNISLGT